MAKRGATTGDILREDVPDSALVPDGGYLTEIAELEATTSNKGKKMFRERMTVVASQNTARRAPHCFARLSPFASCFCYPVLRVLCGEAFA